MNGWFGAGATSTFPDDTGLSARVDYLSEDKMSARKGEIPSLDGLRALSIIVVLCGHFVDKRIPGGLGVLVFFVISGFLISRLLLAEFKSRGTIQLKDFYIRRFLRLYPIIVVLVVVVICVALAKGTGFRIIEPLSALFYFANYYYSWLFAHGLRETLPFSIFWSLSIEEHFYFVFPGLLLALRCDVRRLMIAMLAAMVACLALRIAVAAWKPELIETSYFYFRSEFRLDSLAIGVLITALCELTAGRRFLRSLSHPAIVTLNLVLVGLCFAVRDPWFRETVRYSILGIAISGLVSAVLFSSRYPLVINVLNLPLLRLVGRLSYSLYVWHLSVAYFLGANAYSTNVRLVLEIGGTIIVALLSYYGIERPFLSLRHRFGSDARA